MHPLTLIPSLPPSSSLTPPILPSAPSQDVLLEKHYKGIVNRSAVETFWEEVTKRSKREVRILEGTPWRGEDGEVPRLF